MATQLQIRRGTNTQNGAFTGAEGELSANTTNDSVHVHDGSTAGGFELARADFGNISTSATLTIATLNTTNLDLTNLEVTNLKAKDGTAAGSIADSTGVVTLISSALTTADITTLKIGGTAVTSTAAELNILDGVTSTAAELNILDGVTSTTAELNILDGVTSTTAELNILDGVTSTTAELNILDGVTATATELNYVDGVTSAIQTQIDAKAPTSSPTFTGTVTIPTADINGGTADSVVIGASTPAAGTFTTFTSNGIDDNADAIAITIDSSENVGIGTDSAGTFRTKIKHSAASVTTGLGIEASANDSVLRVFHSGSLAGFNATYSSTGAYVPMVFNVGAGGEAMRIDTSGNVGIGESDNSGYLAPDLVVVAKAQNGGITVKSSSTSHAGTLAFADATSGTAAYDGYIQYEHNNRALTLASAGSEAMRIDSAGDARFAANATGAALIKGVSGDQTSRNSGGYPQFTFVGNEGTGIRRPSANVLAFDTGGDEAARIDSSGSVGIGDSSPSQKLTVNGNINVASGSGYMFGTGAVQMYSNSSYLRMRTNSTDRLEIDSNGTVYGGNYFFIVDTDTGILRSSTNEVSIRCGGNDRWLVTTSGVSTSGSLSKGSGSFKIDHPLPAKTDTHHLVHSFVEAPQADNIYRGSVDLVGGSATVNIDTAAGMTDGTFVLLNTNVQCFTSNESGWTAIKGSVSGNNLTITAQDNSCTDTISWMVVGERHDQHMLDTEWTDENGKVIVEPIKPVIEE